MLISADLKCYCCGTVAGELIADTRQPRQILAFMPAGEAVQSGHPNRCQRCGGPLFMDEAQTLTRHEAAMRLRRHQRAHQHVLVAAGA